MTHDELVLLASHHGGDVLREIVELHKPTKDGLGCSFEYNDCHDHSGLGCDVPSTCNQYRPYPCYTIRLIVQHLPQNQHHEKA